MTTPYRRLNSNALVFWGFTLVYFVLVVVQFLDERFIFDHGANFLFNTLEAGFPHKDYNYIRFSMQWLAWPAVTILHFFPDQFVLIKYTYNFFHLIDPVVSLITCWLLTRKHSLQRYIIFPFISHFVISLSVAQYHLGGLHLINSLFWPAILILFQPQLKAKHFIVVTALAVGIAFAYEVSAFTALPALLLVLIFRHLKTRQTSEKTSFYISAAAISALMVAVIYFARGSQTQGTTQTFRESLLGGIDTFRILGFSISVALAFHFIFQMLRFSFLIDTVSLGAVAYFTWNFCSSESSEFFQWPFLARTTGGLVVAFLGALAGVIHFYMKRIDSSKSEQIFLTAIILVSGISGLYFDGSMTFRWHREYSRFKRAILHTTGCKSVADLGDEKDFRFFYTSWNTPYMSLIANNSRNIKAIFMERLENASSQNPCEFKDGNSLITPSGGKIEMAPSKYFNYESLLKDLKR